MAAVASVGITINSGDAQKKLRALAKQSQETQKALGGFGTTAKNAATGFAGMGSAAKAAAPGIGALGIAIKSALGPIVALTSAAGAITQSFSILAKQDFAQAKVRSLGVNSDALVGKLKNVSAELQGQADIVELTAASYDVASAGFTNATSAAEILSAAGKGAIGGFSDIGTVADATTSVLNSYGLASDQAAKLVDGFIQTQNDGKIVIGEYAANISKVAPVAAALKVPLEEVNAAVAQITGSGTGAEVTFTALKTALAQLATGAVGEKLKAYGLDIDAASVASDGLAGTLEKIKKAGVDSGTVLKAFGTEAGPVILELLNNSEKYNKLLENQKNAQGAAAKAAFTATDTIDGQIKRLQSAFTNLIAEQSVFGQLIKEIFKIAAVTVEAFGTTINLLLTPVKASQALFEEIRSTILQAFGTDAVSAAMTLEEAFQSVRRAVDSVGQFVIGLARIIGRAIGGAVNFALSATEGLRRTLLSGFQNTIGQIPGILANLYNSLPEFIKGILARAVGFAKGAFGAIMEAGAPSGGAPVAAGGGGSGLPTTSILDDAAGGKGKGKKAARQRDEAAERAKRIAEASAERVRQLENQRLLASALNEEERQQFERQIKINELVENKKGLTREQLNAELNALTALFQQEDTTKSQLQIRKDLEEAAKRAADAEAKRAEKLAAVYSSIGDSIKTGIVDALTAAVDQTKSLAEVASDVLRNIANTLIQFGLNTALGGLGGGNKDSIFTKLFGGGMANGGRVSSNRSYLVGERGPELFVPKSSGTIVPNGNLGGGMASVTVNVDASGSSVQGDNNQASQLGKAIGAAVQAELVKQKRPGGLLAGV